MYITVISAGETVGAGVWSADCLPDWQCAMHTFGNSASMAAYPCPDPWLAVVSHAASTATGGRLSDWSGADRDRSGHA